MSSTKNPNGASMEGVQPPPPPPPGWVPPPPPPVAQANAKSPMKGAIIALVVGSGLIAVAVAAMRGAFDREYESPYSKPGGGGRDIGESQLATLRGYVALSEDYAIWKEAMLAAAEHLVSKGRCEVEHFRINAGWTRAPEKTRPANHPCGRDTCFFIHCADDGSTRNSWYVLPGNNARYELVRK